MKLATVVTPGGLRLHASAGDGYVDVVEATGDDRLSDVGAVLRAGPGALERIAGAAERGGRQLSESEYAPAVPAPTRILCLGVNYAEHAAEGGRAPTTWPEVFVRGAGSVAAPFGELVKPALSERFDYEGELGLVIGAGGRYIRAEEAMSAIAGYVVVMDGSAREWQRAATQWTPGKNFDATMPIGPAIVTVDEVDVSDVAITTKLNGEVMQSARTSEMTFGIPATIEYLSSFTTLMPGDVIATGTPSGVGFARTPPVWLTPGDRLEVEVENVGRIANDVVAEQRAVDGWPWQPPATKGSGI